MVVIIGAIFALQGFGVIEGSAMSDNHTFEVVGPVVALAGLALAALGLRHRRIRLAIEGPDQGMLYGHARISADSGRPRKS